MERLLEMGLNAGFSVVEVFRESGERLSWQEGSAGIQKHGSQFDRIAVRCFWEQGDPVHFALGKPDWKSAANAFNRIRSAVMPRRGRNYGSLLPDRLVAEPLRVFDGAVNADERDQLSAVREAVSEALVSFPGLKMLNLSFHRQLRKIHLLNSRGFSGKYKKSLFSLRLFFSSRDRVIEIAEDTVFFNQINPFNLVARAQNLLNSITDQAPPNNSGGNLILAPEAAAVLVADCADLFSLTETAGKKPGAAAPVLTLADHPRLEARPGSVPFDDEGVTAREKVLLNKGVFSATISDLESAFAGGKQGGGNGFRDPRTLVPRTLFSNLVVKPSAYPLDRLISESGRGILVTRAGRRTDSGFGTGDVYSLYGYLFQGGDFSEAVHFQLQASPASFLNSVQMVSKEIKFFKSNFVVGAPYLLCSARRRRDGMFVL